MKKSFRIFLLIFLINYSNCFANSFVKDSTEFSNKSIVGIAKLVYAYMVDYELTLQKFNNKPITPGERKGMELFKIKFLDVQNSSDTPKISLDSIEYFLALEENSWSSNGKNVFLSLNDNYKRQLDNKNYDLESVFFVDDKIKKIYIQNLDESKNEGTNWNKALINILGFTPNNNDSYTNNKILKYSVINNQHENEKTYSRNNNPNNFLKYFYYLILLILGGLLGFIFFNKQVEKILRIEYDNYNNIIKNSVNSYPLFCLGVIKYLKEQKDKYKKKSSFSNNEYVSRNFKDEYYELLKRSRLLETENFQLKDKFRVENSNSSSAVGDGNVENTHPTKQLIKNTLYYSVPERDGAFLDENSALSPAVRSYFKITYIEGEQKGELIYRGGSLDPSAISQMDLILGPVCEIENISISEANAINIISNGTVIRANKRWMVKEKIQLKLT